VPIWADILLAFGLALVFGVVFAVIFALSIEYAKVRALQPFIEDLGKMGDEMMRNLAGGPPGSADLPSRYALLHAPQADGRRRDEEPPSG
jgi:hypothetical protein